MRILLAFFAGLAFFFAPALLSFYSIFLPIEYEWAIVIAVAALFLWGAVILKEVELEKSLRTILECFLLASYVAYVITAAYENQKALPYPWLFVLFSLIALVYAIKLFALVSPAIFEGARRNPDKKYGRLTIYAVGIFSFWIFFWLRLGEIILTPSLLSYFIGVILLFFTVISWLILKEFPLSFRIIISNVLFIFHLTIIVSLIVFLFISFKDIDLFYLIVFSFFWIIFDYYNWRTYNKYDILILNNPI